MATSTGQASLGARVKVARQHAGFSQRGLAEAAELALSHISSIEADERPQIAAKTVAALARALDVSIDWLMTGEGRGPRRSRSGSMKKTGTDG